MLIERVRRALEPDYEILVEIAGGGMGLVFAARQRRLDRKVAIKILRPEQATAIGAERFLTEGRLLARLAHPNIVPIYDAGEADGLLYYVMEYVEGETLADRLLRGPLSAQEALAVVRDLLSALGAAHAHGIVHRDVKPANIFMRDGRALLGDFGIARWREKGEPGYTTPGEMIGTPRYMAPEQRDGLPATARTDVYAAGLVLYEACSGDRWPYYQEPKAADWTRLPPSLALSVRRALELAPEDRWADAGEFAGALAHRPRSRRAVPVVALLLLGTVVVGYRLIKGHGEGTSTRHAGLTIVVERFSGVNPALGDSIAAAIREQLRGPDFNVLAAGQDDGDSTVLRLGGNVVHAGSLVSLTLEDRRPAGGRTNPLAVRASESAPEDWRAAADTLATDLLQQIWEREDQFLPADALPRTNQGKRLFFAAEQLWSRAQWEQADAAYKRADRTDPSCALCSFRLLDIARWLGDPQDTARLRRIEREQDRFSPVYQALIHAMSTPLPARLDSLKSAAASWPKFYLAWFSLGDELLHRGALYGHLRREAADPLYHTIQLVPHFDPGWEHLAFFRILQGDRAGADTALSALGAAAPGSQFSEDFRTLLQLGYAWRFLDPAAARSATGAALANPSVRASTDVAGGARLLMMLDAPRGAVELGAMLAGLGDPGAVRGGLLGQLDGYAALGQLDLLRAAGLRLRREGYDSEALLALELEVVLRCFDPNRSLCAVAGLSRALEDRLGVPALRRRAAWALALLAIRSGQPELAALARQIVAADRGAASLTQSLAAADSLARGAASATLRALPSLPPLESETAYADPLEDAVARLLHSEALVEVGQTNEAAGVLRWQEHVQLSGHLTDAPQPGEMAWALGTLVRWNRARLLDSVDSDPATVEHCSVYQDVARLWHGAPPPFGPRADSAKSALQRLHCPA